MLNKIENKVQFIRPPTYVKLSFLFYIQISAFSHQIIALSPFILWTNFIYKIFL